LSTINTYYNEKRVDKAAKAGRHRGQIGGLWNEIGQLQFEYLRDHGVSPAMRLLDVGCGCLRGGIHFVRYLNAGNYYGIDLSQSLLDAGYDIELKKLGLHTKIPRENLRQSGDFDASPFGVSFDAALALSLFTHLPLNHIRLCLDRLGDVMTVGAQFFATAFMLPSDGTWRQEYHHSPGTIVTHPDRDPYHYQPADIEYACHGLPWKLLRIEDWNHPRNQSMCVFERI